MVANPDELTLYVSDHPFPSQVQNHVQNHRDFHRQRSKKCEARFNTPGCSFCWLFPELQKFTQKIYLFFSS